MIFEMLWFGSILSCAGLYVWSYAASCLSRKRPRPEAGTGDRR
ncbi:hypothetical protein [Inquilinus limosus]|nr:hypothetical protein [Inquilinus limosus]